MEPAQLCRNGSEHGEQSALFCWAETPETREALPALYGKSGKVKLFAINNNAGSGDEIRGARAKMAGVKSGVGDTFLPVARHGVHGLFIELKQRKYKTRKGGGLSPEQVDFYGDIRADDYGYVVAYGWEEAAEILKLYLV